MSLEIKRRRLALPQRRISSSSKWIGYLALLSLLAAIGIIFNNGIIGQGVVILLGIIALVFRIRSEESFKLALAAFVVVMFSTVFNVNMLAQHFSTYAFLFLGAGLACAIKEQLQSYSDVLIKSSVIRSIPRSHEENPKGKHMFINSRSR